MTRLEARETLFIYFILYCIFNHYLCVFTDYGLYIQITIVFFTVTKGNKSAKKRDKIIQFYEWMHRDVKWDCQFWSIRTHRITFTLSCHPMEPRYLHYNFTTNRLLKLKCISSNKLNHLKSGVNK